MQRLAIRPVPGSERKLVFLTKAQCSLCEEAAALLPLATEGLGFTVDRVDVNTDRFLKRHFNDAVPVLLWQGDELARLRWDPGTLRARLEEIAARRPAERQQPS